MISRMPLMLFGLFVAYLSLIPEKYFLWGIILTGIIAIGMIKPGSKKQLPLDFAELFTIRGLGAVVLFAVPFILAPVYLWGPYTIQGYEISQNSAFILGFVITSLATIGFLTEKRSD